MSDRDDIVFSNDQSDASSSTTRIAINNGTNKSKRSNSNVQLTLQESLTMRKKKCNVESKNNTTQGM